MRSISRSTTIGMEVKTNSSSMYLQVKYLITLSLKKACGCQLRNIMMMMINKSTFTEAPNAFSFKSRFHNFTSNE